MKTMTCYRCHKRLPLSSFYQRADGSLIGGCKECHRELSAARRAVDSASLRLPVLSSARIVSAPSTPPLAVWTCEACRCKRTSPRLDQLPPRWRKLAGVLPGDPLVLCSPCGVKAQRGVRILSAALARRGSGPSRS